ncbi:MAG: SpoIIE family protein phosphatase [Clostridia bacterium]|nr:SpoIIE family protein phosphatase [Clostridia bacterium]
MKKKTSKFGKIRELIPPSESGFYGQALTFAAAFVLANARLVWNMSPFVAAFAASVPGKRSIAATLGGCCGCLLNIDGAYTARLIAVTVCTGLINFCLYRSGFVRNNLMAAPVSSALCSLLTGITVMVAQGFSPDGIITYLSESIIGTGCACFLSRLSFTRGFFKGMNPLDTRQLSGVLVFMGMLVTSAQTLNLEGIRLSDIAAAVIILISARLAGISGGCAAGGVMGFAVSISSTNLLLGGLYTFGGLAAGLLSRFGRAVQCIGFAGVAAVMVMANVGRYNVVSIIYEIIISLLIFTLIPKKFFEANSRFFVSDDTVPEFEAMKKALLLELESVSGGLDEVSQAVERIADEMVKLENSEDDRNVSVQTRRLVRDQFATLSTAVKEISQSFCGETKFDTQASARVSAVLAGYGINPKEVVCSTTGTRSKIDIKADKINSKISRTALTGDMEAVCGYKLGIPSVIHTDDTTLISFEKRPKYNLRTGQAQHTAEGRLCGDTVDSFTDREGNRVIVISDGMGTGPKAAVDGTVAAWLFSKLIAAGLGFDSSLRLANSALIVKSTEESLATIDSVKINLHTGKAEFYKAGAGISLICKGRKLYRAGGSSMPIGILREIEFDKSEIKLRRGDRLLMMSDGVPQSAYKEIAGILSNFNKNDPSELAERVVEVALKYSDSRRPDDITAVVIIVG